MANHRHEAQEAHSPTERTQAPQSGTSAPKGPVVTPAAALTGMTWTRLEMPMIVGNHNQRRVLGQLAFGDGTSTYPSGGIPVPAPKNFQGGMAFMRQLNYIDIVDTTNLGAAQGMAMPNYSYDRTHQTIRMFHPGALGGASAKDGVEYATTDVVPISTIIVEAYGI